MDANNPFVLEPDIAATRLSPLQGWIIALCGAVALIDGFDTQAIAFVAPHISGAWHIKPAAFGPVFGAGLLGSFIGALVFGPLGDRIGRKPALLLSISIFAAGSLATAWVASLAALVGMRVVTGFGLGGALPCFIALASEYAPRHRRESTVSLMFCGFPVGAVIGGLVSEVMVAAWGWPSLFIVGGLAPVVIGAIFMAVVPESISYLTHHGRLPEAKRILARMGLRQVDEPTGSTSSARAPISTLFTGKRALGTPLLWTTLFLSLLLTYFLINWIPLVARAAGANVGAAVIAVALLNFGAICGCLVIGRLADRYAPPPVIGCAYAVGAIAIVLIGQAQRSGMLLCVTAFFAGMLSIGAQMCTVSFCASFYGTQLRSTGVGWSMGVGRVGAMAGPVLGGVLISSGLEGSMLFLIAGILSLLAGGTTFLMRFALPEKPDT